MTLLQMQQLSRQPADYGAEILVQVINTNYYFGNLSNLGNYCNCVCWVIKLFGIVILYNQDDHVFATSRGTGVLIVYKIESSGKLSRWARIALILDRQEQT